MFLAFFAKIASAGIAAKAAAAAGVVVVGVTTAGFTHELPAPIQSTWDSVVTADEPTAPAATDGSSDTTVADPSGATTPPGTSTAPESPDGDTEDTGDADGSATRAATTTPAVPAQQTSGNGLGGTVSQMAPHGGMAGGSASELAHTRNEERRSGGSSTASSGPSTGDDSATSGKDSGSGSKGKGHSNG